MSENLLAPYAPDLSDWDPSCRLGWWPWVTDEQLRHLAELLEGFPGASIGHPELDLKTKAEEMLLSAWSGICDVVEEDLSIVDEDARVEVFAREQFKAQQHVLIELRRIVVAVLTYQPL